jgi:hypothetical protein
MTVEERLEKLERELAAAKRNNRRLLIAAGLLVGISALAWLITGSAGIVQAQEAEEVPNLEILETGNIIRANGFILEDAEGRTRAELVMTEGEPRLRLLDEYGKNRAVLGMNEVKKEIGLFLLPGLGLYDENGVHRAMLLEDSLNLYNEDGVRWAQLRVSSLLGGSLSLDDENSVERVHLAASDASVLSFPGLSLYDENSDLCSAMYVNELGPFLFMTDKNNMDLNIFIDDNRGPMIRMYKNERLIWQAP